MEMMSLTPTAGAVVSDVADADRHGKIISAGSEVSEVRFDGGAERNVPNKYLRPVGLIDDELTRSTDPGPEETAIHRGREAWRRLRDLNAGRLESRRQGVRHWPKHGDARCARQQAERPKLQRRNLCMDEKTRFSGPG